MVSETKLKLLADVTEQVKSHPVVGIVDMHAMPAGQLHDIRGKLRGKARIRMVKKAVLVRALEAAGKKELLEFVRGQPTLLLSNMNPFELARLIDTSKSPAAAKAGDVAPRDIVVPAGPTPFGPGPVIGEFQKVKIPVGVEGEKIAVKSDTVVARAGAPIEKPVADILAKLGITPMEIKLNLLAAWDNGTVYKADVLFVPLEEYVSWLQQAHAAAFNLAVAVGWMTPETVKPLLARAYREAKALAVSAGWLTPETTGEVLALATAQAEALAKLVKVEVSEPAKSA